MHEFVALNLSREEYRYLVRLVGHHTCGSGLDKFYERLCELRPNEATIAANKGPLAMSTPQTCKDIYGERPMVKVGD